MALVLVAVIGCPRPDQRPPTPVESAAAVLEATRARPVPDPVKARFSVKLRSKPLDIAGSTGGGLVIDRPGRARLDLFGPLGGPLFTAASDGAGLSVLLVNERRQLVAVDAERVLRETTGGVAGLDDLLAVLVGDLPFDDAKVLQTELHGDGDGPEQDSVRVVFEGPNGSQVDVLLDAVLNTPRQLVAKSAEGEVLLSATYEGFTAVGDRHLPSRVELLVPSIDLTVDARFRDWEPLAEAPPVFSMDAPDSFTTESLEASVRKIVEEMSQR